MSVIIQDTSTEIFLVVIAVIVFVTQYYRHCYKYWSSKGVPVIPPVFPLGNTNLLLPRGFSVGTLSSKFYNYHKQRGHKFGGVYMVTEPNLVLVDPDLIKTVLTKDFQHFVDRGIYYNAKDDPLSAHLFAVDGDLWRNLRVKFTPTFTSGKMKMMFNAVVQCSDYMCEALSLRQNQDVDIKEVLGRFTTDVIGSCALGITCNSFKDPDAEFRRMGKRIFEYPLWRSMKSFFIVNLPKVALRLGTTTNHKDVQEFFLRIIRDTIKLRQEKSIERNDFLQILIDLSEKVNFSLNEMAAQSFVFFVAGFETSSTAMTFALYELARNPHIQTKLRQEIEEVLAKHGGEITYESLNEMKYLHQALSETMRIYPPLTSLNRRCTKDYNLPGTNVVVETGTPVLISTLGLHMDPEYFPDPETFDPERFCEERKNEIRPFTYLPFGDGPRNCVGLRFGLMQSKIGIASVIRKFRLSISHNTTPVEFDPYTFLLNTIDKVYLKLERI